MKPLVSICCLAYNHGKFIEDAIKGFLMQDVDFDMEIIILDDASTDNTPNIVKKYEQKYPKLIRGIYHSTNQKPITNIPMFGAYLLPEAQGKYIALCEGDDFWIDIVKLKKQVEILENNERYTLCSHATQVKNYIDGEQDYTIQLMSNSSTIPVEKIIQGEGMPHTSSLLFRRELVEQLPEFYKENNNGDIPLVLLCASKGEVYYIDKTMSVYRKGINGSWTRNVKLNPFKYIDHTLTYIKMLYNFNEFTDYKYNKMLLKRIEFLKQRIVDNAKLL
ncbi:glycosyltransferase family 2 protein [Gracilibacillus saliphilus]|uniref:glycosyltransferase family 2 protein n=1 Tax=Gracilibacillus saliphilus TaxID=543890 RepID=UPI0013D72574|nr:glycosyltransferase [Gracilibacillus saliphilus]